MIDYYSRVPAAAVFRSFDGHAYAYIPHRLDAAGQRVRIAESFDAPRMVRADAALYENGEALILFGRAGEAIAPTANLPFGVTVRPT
jgi:hypothetical protein